ncbi:PPOX class F420-dependent oxidoreductase [Streptomyces pathocidini]|uniref:PPOX class F420-dependent oxidoreductase n=1 Tax=Streptomyces pathocidini TaxID=1650571 RepID=A0ABW7UT22_9ACTN|nr:PPOX class F420-dependent oxidoreductase [Streptomyces pathocidini]
MATTDGTAELRPLVRQACVLLTTRKRDGSTVGTPVHIAVEGDHAYIRTFGKAGKTKRMRNFPDVDIAPCTRRGKPTGAALHARVRLLDQGGEENAHAAKLIERKYPVVQRYLVPAFHRLQRDRTLHYEVRLVAERPR